MREYRLYYDDQGNITAASQANHPDTGQYVVVGIDVYENYFRYQIVGGEPVIPDPIDYFAQAKTLQKTAQLDNDLKIIKEKFNIEDPKTALLTRLVNGLGEISNNLYGTEQIKVQIENRKNQILEQKRLEEKNRIEAEIRLDIERLETEILKFSNDIRIALQKKEELRKEKQRQRIYNKSRIAVLLIGQYRSWDIVHPHTFKLFSSMAKQVDYYFVTWPTYSYRGDEKNIKYGITARDILKNFDSDNKLVDYKIVPDIATDNNFYRMCYLGKIANDLKQQTEKQENFVYDQVIETRPDLYFRIEDSDFYTPSAEFEIYSDAFLSIENRKEVPFDMSKHNDQTLNTGHWYYRMSSNTHNFFSSKLDFYNKLLETDPGILKTYKLGIHSSISTYFRHYEQFKIKTKDEYDSAFPIIFPELKDYDLENIHKRTLSRLSLLENKDVLRTLKK